MASRTGSLPRNEKLRFDTPPEMWACGRVARMMPRRLDEGDAVAVVLLDAGRDREDVGIEDDVLGREAGLLDEQLVGAGADLDLALQRVGLALFVEGHHDHGGAIGAHQPGGLEEGLLALLHRDRIDERLALHAFQPGFDDREFRGVDHHRHAGDVGLGRDEVEELDHRLFGVDQALVHVDVDDLGAVGDLVARDVERGREVAVLDQLAEAGRARDVGALADVDEGDVGRQREGLEAREAHQRRDRRHGAGRLAAHRLGDGADVLGRRAAAAADDVDEPLVGEAGDLRRHHLRALVVAAEFVGQAGIRIGADEGVGDARELGQMRPHGVGAERAVEPDGEGLGVAHASARRPSASGPTGCGRTGR